MRDGLAMAYQVIMHPNSAFAALRDNDHRYFPLSIAVVLLSSIQYAAFASLMPGIDAQGQIVYVVASFGQAILQIVIIAGTFYLIGRAFGGNKNWRKVCTVIFYTAIILVPTSALVSLLSSLPPSLLPAFSSVGLHVMMGIPVFVWVVIIHVKTIKVLNGFGTAKAFGILILSGMAQMIWIIPVVLLYLWTTPLALPIMQTLLQ